TAPRGARGPLRLPAAAAAEQGHSSRCTHGLPSSNHTATIRPMNTASEVTAMTCPSALASAATQYRGHPNDDTPSGRFLRAQRYWRRGQSQEADGAVSEKVATPDLRAGVGVVGRRHRAGVGVWAAVRPWWGLGAHLGLYAPGGDRVGQCCVVAFVLVGVDLGEVGHGPVELA